MGLFYLYLSGPDLCVIGPDGWPRGNSPALPAITNGDEDDPLGEGDNQVKRA